jgi:hypothetical protein
MASFCQQLQIRKIARSAYVDPECDNIAENLQRCFEKNALCYFLYEKRHPPVTSGTADAQRKSSALINEVHSRLGDHEGISAASVDLNLMEKVKPKM